jgi:hypothetical protein
MERFGLRGNGGNVSGTAIKKIYQAVAYPEHIWNFSPSDVKRWATGTLEGIPLGGAISQWADRAWGSSR